MHRRAHESPLHVAVGCSDWCPNRASLRGAVEDADSYADSTTYIFPLRGAVKDADSTANSAADLISHRGADYRAHAKSK